MLFPLGILGGMEIEDFILGLLPLLSFYILGPFCYSFNIQLFIHLLKNIS